MLENFVLVFCKFVDVVEQVIDAKFPMILINF